jgi:hypothetical protein
VADYEDRRKKMALVRNFAEFYQSKAMQKLRARADELPFDETLDLQLTFKRIDVELAQLKEALGVKMQQPQGTQKAAKAFNDSAKIVPFPVKGKRPADERHKTQEGQNDNARRRKNKKGKKNKNNAQNQQRFGRRAHG